MTLRKGTLVSLHGSLGSGLVTIPCEAGCTIRALGSAFGQEIVGEEIYFKVDNLGELECFRPIDDADVGGAA